MLGLVTERESLHTFLTGREVVVASAQLHDLPRYREAAADAINLVDMEEYADRRIGTYSKGMRQRIRVACGLVHNPQVLILDEPFNGMDPRQRIHMMSLLRNLGERGHTVLFSSHILEEVERLAGHVQVVVAGRLAASGDYREIRRLMTDRPHVFTVRSTDDRRFATALMSHASVTGVELTTDGVRVQTADFGAFTRLLAGVAREYDLSLREVVPADESLESVFSYLVAP
jgi:ABC-2 type transport system ATP-binding protein